MSNKARKIVFIFVNINGEKNTKTLDLKSVICYYNCVLV